jgi:hypothetical protein
MLFIIWQFLRQFTEFNAEFNPPAASGAAMLLR